MGDVEFVELGDKLVPRIDLQTVNWPEEHIDDEEFITNIFGFSDPFWKEGEEEQEKAEEEELLKRIRSEPTSRRTAKYPPSPSRRPPE